jgi:hypothetical protein
MRTWPTPLRVLHAVEIVVIAAVWSFLIWRITVG